MPGLMIISQVNVVVFDKTGTLTAGKPVVTAVTPSGREMSADSILSLAALVESNTTHPVAQAIVHAAAANASSRADNSSADAPASHSGQLEPGTFVQEPGSGVFAIVSGKRVSVGSLEWLSRQGVYQAVAGPEGLAEAARLRFEDPLPSSSSGMGVGNSHSRVYVGVDGKMVGSIDVQDSVRSDARSTIDELHRQGVRTVMLSGDHEGAAFEVAAAVGIDKRDVYAGVKPAGASWIRAISNTTACLSLGVNRSNSP